jgi:NADH dehydrogenase [ubiquinone] 1 alpha subcomplex assembly factor 7
MSDNISKIKETLVNLESVVDQFEQRGLPTAEFEFDRSGLHPFGLKKKVALNWKDLEAKKGPRTELTKHLHAIIETRGPMSMSTFMNYALTHPVHGYYMKSDVFGKAGDFTTSPEISQMFGELLGVWCAAMWENLGRPSKIHLVELGPGRGTLSNDMLNAVKHMHNFFKSIHLHLVEVSPHLRRIQAQKFGLVYPSNISSEQISAIPVPAGLEHHDLASTAGQATAFSLHDQKPNTDPGNSDTTEKNAASKTTFSAGSSASHSSLLPDVTLKTLPGTSISWHARFEDVPEFPAGEPVLVIAQEFFDALPIYQLEMTSQGWRERLVDIDDRPETTDWFRTTLAPSPTPACALIDESDLPSTGVAAVGMGVEKCAEGTRIAQSIADRLLANGGAALFIDYGHEIMSGWSIRGIQNHQFVSIYKDVGDVDLSANVDFTALSRTMISDAVATRPHLDRLDNLNVYGPINQGEFLAALGIYSRLAKLLRSTTTEDDAAALIASFKRLTDKDQMGATYKVMGVFSNPKLTPEGFWGLFPSTRRDPTGSSL